MQTQTAPTRRPPIKASLDIDGNQIRLARLGLRWTQRELAERSGVDRVSISYIEGGKIEKARLATMRAIARALEDAGAELSPTGVTLQGLPSPRPAMPDLPLESDDQANLRRRLAARIGHTKNLADPAREIGVTSQTLKAFLAGGRAYIKTAFKFEAWLAVRD